MSILIIDKENSELKKSLSSIIAKEGQSIRISSYREVIEELKEIPLDYDIIIMESKFNEQMDATGFSNLLKSNIDEINLPTLIIYSPESYDFLLGLVRSCNYPKINFLQKPNLSMLKQMIESIYSAEKYTYVNKVADKNYFLGLN